MRGFEEAAKSKIKVAQAAEALRRSTAQRVATANPASNGFGLVLSRAASSRPNPMGTRSKKDAEAALGRLITSGNAPPQAVPQAEDVITVDPGFLVGS